MQQAAISIMEQYGGTMPQTYEELKQLKGIGSYTAGAIASIAFGEAVPAVDGNVLRVMKRLSGSYDDIMKASVKNALEKELKEIMPKRAGAFNQAIMDLGAMVCIPNGQPLCEECPLGRFCQAKKKNIQMELPVKTKKKARRLEEKTILLLEYQNRYAIRKREKNGLLAGLWELPSIQGKISKTELEHFFQEEEKIVEIKELGEAKHIFSHVEWSMVGYHVILEEPSVQEEYVWASKKELQEKYAIPTAFSSYLG